MNDYDKNSFYSYVDNTLSKRRFYIKVKNNMIEVNKDIYYVCYNSYRKQLRDNKRDALHGLVALDYNFEGGYALSEVIGEDEHYLDEIHNNDLIELIVEVMEELNEEDKELITELLIQEKKERELEGKYKIAHQTINRKKRRIIKEIRKRIEKNEKN